MAPAKKVEPKEVLKQKLKSKQVYHCVGEGFDVVSREVFKSSEIHYPFDTRNGSQKYKFVRTIQFEGISPKVVHGVYKDWRRGLGFTRYLSPVIDFFGNNFPRIGKIVISKKQRSAFKTLEVIFNVQDLEHIYQRIRPFRDQQSEELRAITRDLAADVFPRAIKKEPLKYYSGELTRLIEAKAVKSKELSSNDIQAIGNLLTGLPMGHAFIKTGKLIATKEKFDIVSIEATLKEYKRLLARKNDSKKLEEDWHQFFKKHSWILAQMFASPMVILDDKAYVGGKGINNQGGKIADFIYRNSFSRSVAIIEIKTHKTKLLVDRAYRKPDVFSISSELGGAINQALDQKDTLQKEYHSVVKNAGVESFNPVCIVLGGSLSNIKRTASSLSSFLETTPKTYGW